MEKENDELEGKLKAETKKKIAEFLKKLKESQEVEPEESQAQILKKKLVESVQKDVSYETTVMDIEQFKNMGLTAPNTSIDHFIYKLYNQRSQKNN